jgi:uncharacterized protein YdcH (DUF465 family)
MDGSTEEPRLVFCEGNTEGVPYFEEINMTKLQAYSIAFVVAFTILVVRLGSAADQPKPVQLVPDAQVKVLKAKLALKDAEAELQGLVAQFNALNQQMADLRAKAPAAQTKIADAQKAFDALKDELAKGLGLDPKQYTLDADKLVLSPLPPPATTTPSPDKK